ncbi:MAG TPA: hypothetical protein VL992_21400 [Tepidisphaeraceae bacterium]|nr:hypothetical protein [Tepidisphaeraceae bacterium]
MTALKDFDERRLRDSAGATRSTESSCWLTCPFFLREMVLVHVRLPSKNKTRAVRFRLTLRSVRDGKAAVAKLKFLSLTARADSRPVAARVKRIGVRFVNFLRPSRPALHGQNFSKMPELTGGNANFNCFQLIHNHGAWAALSLGRRARPGLTPAQACQGNSE